MILKIDLKIVKLNDALRKMQKCQFCGKQYKELALLKTFEFVLFTTFQQRNNEKM